MSPLGGDGAVQAVEVVVPVDDVELASDRLWAAGVSAISEVESGALVVLTADVPADGGLAAIQDAVAGRWPVLLVDVADDGLDGWRPYAEVVRAGRHLVVQPPWLPYEAAPDDVVLRIDPGRSFGHGAHPTTRLCLAEVERLLQPGATVLDVGCGSGVLAVAAAKLGATRVVAVDVDPEAVAATAANAAANDVAIEVSDRPLAEVDGAFDLVIANIGAATLVELRPALVAAVADGGALVLSGLLADRGESTVAVFAGCAIERTTEADGWMAVVLRR